MTDSARVGSDRCRIAVVVVAAGASARMGPINKLLLEVGGRSLVRSTVESVLEVDPSECWVVLGHQRERVLAELDGLGCRTVVNSDWRLGQKTSVLAGLRSLLLPSAGVMVCLGDLAKLEPDDLRFLKRAFEATGVGRIVVPFYRGHRGNPVVLDRTLVPRILALGADHGVRRFIDENPALVDRVEMPNDHCVFDIDTPEQWAEFAGRAPSDESVGSDLGP